MPMTGIEIAKLTCTVLVNCVSIYKTIDAAITEYNEAPDDAQKLGEEIQIGILRIEDIATVLFKNGIIDQLKGRNAETVLKGLKRLESILRKYGDWVTDAKLNAGDVSPKSEHSSTSELPTTLTFVEASSNEELFKMVIEAVKS